MLVEAGTAIALAMAPPQGVSPVLSWAGLALLAVVWAFTFRLQVPAYERLGQEWNARVHARLVRTSWNPHGGLDGAGRLALAMAAETC